jgi:ribosomal protein S18 acetylase RimI-like enzyme
LDNPEPSVLKEITREELESFWNRLSAEKEYLSNPLVSNLTFVVGIKQDNQIVGIGGLKRHFGLFQFMFFVVKTEFQAKGFGSAIVSEIFKYARGKSYPLILASTYRENTASLKLLNKLGFKTLYKSYLYYRLGIPLNTFGEVLVKIIPVLFHFYFLHGKYLGEKE